MINRKALFGAVLAVLRAANTQGGEMPVKLTQEPATVKVEIDGKPFTTYYFNDGMGKPYVRPFFYPVLAADGTLMTSDQSTAEPSKFMPKIDHPHHRSLWVAQGEVKVGDKEPIDHWAFSDKTHPNREPAHQTHVKFDKVEGDTIQEELTWDDYDHKPVLNETRTFRFLTLGDGSRAIDFTSAFTPAGAVAVTFGDTKEAGICAVRVNPQISFKPTITNATGIVVTGTDDKKNTAWGKPAKWCDESGEIDGKPYGITIFDHPTNPRHPTTWHVRGYGLMAANIFGLHDFDKTAPKGAGDLVMEPGKTVTFKYRVVFHGGDAKSANLDEKWAEFAK